MIEWEMESRKDQSNDRLAQREAKLQLMSNCELEIVNKHMKCARPEIAHSCETKPSLGLDPTVFTRI